jgi:hypothetical protein
VTDAGARLDQEVDAAMVLVLSVGVATVLGWWALIGVMLGMLPKQAHILCGTTSGSRWPIRVRRRAGGSP